MKYSLCFLAAIGSITGMAQAQSSVTIYGIADVGVVSATNSSNLNCGFVTCVIGTGNQNVKLGTVVGIMNGGESASRFGLKGIEDMGGGNKAFFNLESGINFGSGLLSTSALAGNGSNSTLTAGDSSLEGQLFGRAANMGLSTQYGSLTLGRMNSLQSDIIINGYDPVSAQVFSPISFSGSYGGGALTDDNRVDNAIKYSNTYHGVNINALYKFGGVSGNTASRSAMEANIGYESENYGVQAAYQQFTDGTALSGSNLSNTVGVTIYDTTSYMLAAKYKPTSKLQFNLGYENYVKKAASDPQLTTDGSLTSVYGYSVSSPAAYTGTNINYNVFWLGGNYQATPSIKLSLGYYNVQQGAYNSSTTTATSIVAKNSGTSQYFSAMAEYMLSLRTNLYAAYIHTSLTDNAVLNGFDTFDTFGLGIRHTF